MFEAFKIALSAIAFYNKCKQMFGGQNEK